MAQGFDVSRHFPPKPPHLKIGKEINRGSYGTVHEGELNGQPVAIKKIHCTLLETSDEQKKSIVENFTRECSLLETADDVHVVQFYGAYYDRESRAPILVMEKLHQNLREYLEENQGKLSVLRQLQICLEISSGVNFLHSLVPSVIHRDLNDKNVMLTEEGLVKVGDLGQSRLKEGNIDYFTTAQPGAIPFMPPEALQEAARYDEKIDTFSIGVLMLEIATQQSPQVGLVGIGAVPEVKRREKDLSVLSKNHPSYSLILNCLKDNPEDRPTATKLTQKLQELIRQNQQKLIVQHEPLSDGGKPSRGHQTAEQTKHIIPEKGGPDTSGQEESKLSQQAKPKPPEPMQRKRRIPVPKDPNIPVDVLPPGTVVEGIYSFQALQESDLSFEKGDELEITASAPKTANWYSARRVRDGCVGEIPSNYVSLIDIELVLEDAPGPVDERRPVVLSPMNWYHGNLSNSESEALLKGSPNGTYLVRNSDRNPGQFTLCLSCGGQMFVYTISWLNGCFKIAGNKLHKSLTELILHHTKHLDGLRALLQNPIPVKGNIMYDVDPDQFTQNKWTVLPGEVVRGEVLCKGEFKDMFCGKMKGEKVSVQVFKDNSWTSPLAFCDALVEAAIMTTLNHPNLVQLTGVHVNHKYVWMVTEFVEKGSLVEYLRSKGTLVHKSLQLKFAIEICSGMAYLEQKNLVHKCLIAAHILLTADLTAKISEFSLLRPPNFNHEVMGAMKLPVKWAAPELIIHTTPSSSSDVWSFGVLLWEIYSYGEFPYPGKRNQEAVLYVSQGGRMAPPEGCPSAMQGIMKACWADNPQRRPPFSELLKILNTFKPSTNTLPVISQETKLLSPGQRVRSRSSSPGYSKLPSVDGRSLRRIPAQRKKEAVTSPGTVHSDGKNVSHKIPVKLYKAPWFCGLLSRSDAESKLVPKQNGMFLIRQCTIFQEDYAICVCRVASGWAGFEHYQIKFTKEQFSIDGEREAFDSLIQLVDHYKKCPGIIVPRLVMPVSMGKSLKCLVQPGDFTKNGWHIPKDELLFSARLRSRGLPEVWTGMHKGMSRDVEFKIIANTHQEVMIHNFLMEAATMTMLDHPNLVQLIGISLDQSISYMITESMEKESLLEHVRLEGSSMQRSWQIGCVRDISSGMAYLEQKDLVHRDLTAANILLSASKVAKVSNFGSTCSAYYITTGVKVPVKWTAPEAIEFQKFSNKSDVWSFGVVLWEVYSFGKQPYQKHTSPMEMLSFLFHGGRLDCPKGCPPEVYNVMKKCWCGRPENRPKFSEIRELLKSLPVSACQP